MSVAPPIPPLPEDWDPKTMGEVLEAMQRRLQELQTPAAPAAPLEKPGKPGLVSPFLLLGT